MQTLKIEMGEVVYNAATQMFESTVAVHDAAQSARYPCAIAAPITLSFEDAAKGLSRQALRRHGKPSALRSLLSKPARSATVTRLRRGLPFGEYGFFRGRAA